MTSAFKSKGPEWRLGALGIANAVLGGVVLVLSVMFFVLYQVMRKVGVIPQDIVADVNVIAAGVCFGILAPLGVGLIVTAHGIRSFLKGKL